MRVLILFVWIWYGFSINKFIVVIDVFSEFFKEKVYKYLDIDVGGMVLLFLVM